MVNMIGTRWLRRALRVAIVAVLLCLAAVAPQVARAPSALALGPGRVCVFYFPFGSGGLIGHTAWAFSVPGSSTWICGSADHDQGGNSPHGFDQAPITNGVWVISASQGFNDVLSTFRARLYIAYTCKNTPTSAVGGAQNLAFSDRDWTPLGNNCGRHVDDILSTYYGGTFTDHYGSNVVSAVPCNWFNSLPGSGGQGFDAIEPLFAPSGFKGGTVKTDGLAMRGAGQTGPASLSSPVVRRTSLGTRLVIVCWMNGPSITATWADGRTFSTSVWDAVVDANATSLNDGTRRLAVSDAWLDTGGDTSRLIGHC
jgi:hypothetical protein